MKQKFTPYIYILFSILFFDQSYSQELVLKVSATDSTSSILLREIPFQKAHFNENGLLKSLDSVKHKIERMGFLNNSLDSLIKKDSIYIAYFNLRNQIKQIRVNYDKGEITTEQLSNIKGLVTPDYFEISIEKLPNKLAGIAIDLESKGNSFSEVALKNLSVINDTLIEADFFIKKSTIRKIDKIIINGYTNFPDAYLKHHLKLKLNTLFGKEKLDHASNAIYALPFVSEIKSPEVLFTKDSTIVYLHLKKENTNRFDGLIGFTSKEDGKGLSFNGYLDLSLNNLFNSGENLNLVWKNNGNDRQVFNLDITIPYLFKSKTSPNLTLNIYKQDSSFVNTLFKFSLPYHLNTRNSIGLSLHLESSSNLLTAANNDIEDYNSTFFGLNYNYNIPKSHPIFKTKFNIFSEVLFGKRNGSFQNNQSKFFLKTNYIYSLNPKSHIFLQNLSGLINSKIFIDNELLRIGGTNNLRGFDEESLLASMYSVFNIEYRFNTNNSSYLYSISDLGYVKNNNLTSQLYALGIGYAFSSKLGFINLSYALGKSSETPFNFSNSRFHLKIVNFF